MAYIIVDQPNITVQSISSTDVADTPFVEEGFVIPVIIPISEVAELLANYDASSGTSPSVTYSRPIARAILDALKRKVEEG